MGRAAPGTIAPNLTRFLVQAGVAAGLERSRLVGLPGVGALNQDGVRIPTAAVLKAWELLPRGLWDAGGINQIMKLWQPGALGVWDYLFPVADTLDAAFRAAARHFQTLVDPADRLAVTRDGNSLTIDYQSPYRDHEQYPRVAQFVPYMLITMATAAYGRPLVPLRVGLPDACAVSPTRAVELYRTDRVEDGVELPSITFSEADVDTPLPRADPALSAILNSHAELSAVNARTVLGWLDRFHQALESAVADGLPRLDEVAHDLALSPRTLQRRLRDENTSWREELESLRQRRTERLLQETDLGMDAIAARVGFTDSRSLRRAVHRWYGHGPAIVRGSGPA